eukprot:scaffold111335_cov44-Prasinocladus_malaysianus.AAC.2
MKAAHLLLELVDHVSDMPGGFLRPGGLYAPAAEVHSRALLLQPVCLPRYVTARGLTDQLCWAREVDGQVVAPRVLTKDDQQITLMTELTQRGVRMQQALQGTSQGRP